MLISNARRRLAVCTGAAALVGGLVLAASPASAVVGTSDWAGYLNGAAHSSYSPAETAITPANVSKLVKAWTWRGDKATMAGQPGPALSPARRSPTAPSTSVRTTGTSTS